MRVIRIERSFRLISESRNFVTGRIGGQVELAV